MNLKESFRYQNFLESLLCKTREYLSQPSNVTRIVEIHNRSNSCPSAVNDMNDVYKEREILCTVDKIIKFTNYIVETKQLLSDAIYDAKSSCGIDIDGSISINKSKQSLIHIYEYISQTKDKATKTTLGKAFTFNVNNEQVSYFYDIETVTSIDFDKNFVKNLIKKLKSECDKISSKIDEIMITTKVDFILDFDINDSFDEILDSFCEKIN